MISVASLLQDTYVPGNYFDYNAYVRGDLELGLLENRRGDRLLAIPDTLITSLYKGLEKETGQAARLVLFNCGTWWGKNFYVRFSESISEYYDMAIAEMDMLTFVQCLKECWKTHGWGKLEFDPTYQNKGFIVVKTYNSPYAKQLEVTPDRPSCYLEAGILTSFFSRLTGRELLAEQISGESIGSDCNRFVIGLPDRLKSVEKMIETQTDHETIMQNLISQ
ncbi:4-vinyl reductase 4VR [Thalassoporum mexicanum PCC 7367]|uniref:V4R domain-containing protein n=1 Tax=Thalassoporum mexicanum TaxID=3457544 RepID=UPI00029F8670|nr:V4R domain-containing protein [Pseudanabaena sp. PCC 7367]AFY69150.1 4-vinyl reductase 4VR [Pseudanabaena sp. PCC 7367]